MSGKKHYLYILLGLQWLCVVLIFIITFTQFYWGFSFNYFMFIPLLLVISYKIWMIRFDYSAKKKLEKANRDFHALGRKGRREILYSKGIKKHVK